MRAEKSKFVIVHCSATRPSMHVGAATIDRWHKDRGWRKIGYHYVIKRDGVVEKGRALDRVGAHTYGFNRVSIGICLVGGVDSTGDPENNFTDAQFTSLRTLLDTLLHFCKEAELRGHRDMSPDIDGDGTIEPWEWLKACPSFDVRHWYYLQDSS